MGLPSFLLLPSCPQLSLKNSGAGLQVLRGSHTSISPAPGERLGQGQDEPGACGDTLWLASQEGVSCWKPCPWRFGSCSSCLRSLCPDSDGDRHQCLPITQGSSQDTSDLQPKFHGGSNKLLLLWKCSPQLRP